MCITTSHRAVTVNDSTSITKKYAYKASRDRALGEVMLETIKETRESSQRKEKRTDRATKENSEEKRARERLDIAQSVRRVPQDSLLFVRVLRDALWIYSPAFLDVEAIVRLARAAGQRRGVKAEGGGERRAAKRTEGECGVSKVGARRSSTSRNLVGCLGSRLALDVRASATPGGPLGLGREERGDRDGASPPRKRRR